MEIEKIKMRIYFPTLQASRFAIHNVETLVPFLFLSSFFYDGYFPYRLEETNRLKNRENVNKGLCSMCNIILVKTTIK